MDTETIGVEFKEKTPASKKLLPLILIALVIILDQLTKLLVVKYIPVNTIAASWGNGFLRLIHVCNPGIAFSLGSGWSLAARALLFRLVPLVVIVLVMVVYFRNDDFTQVQRWAITGIAGGGLGNLIDRFFRSEGVIDFVDVQWFGFENAPLDILRMERWPTFNVADAAVVVCGILLIVSFLVTIAKDSKSKNKGTK